MLDAGGTPDLDTARAAVAPPAPASAPTVSVPAPDPAGYDRLLTHLGQAEAMKPRSIPIASSSKLLEVKPAKVAA